MAPPNGPAFPVPPDAPKEGISVRQWYKGHALVALSIRTGSKSVLEEFRPERLAEISGQIADAMVEEDEAQEE